MAVGTVLIKHKSARPAALDVGALAASGTGKVAQAASEVAALLRA